MGRNTILLTKDVLRSDYLSCYSDGTVFQTPNIDSLAENGTIFTNYYCSAPSSGMAVTCMFSGLSAHELERKSFRQVDQFSQTSTLFNDLEKSGVATFVLWSHEFEHLAYAYSRVFDDLTTIHYAPPGGAVEATPQKKAFKAQSKNYDLSEYFFDYITSVSRECERDWFIWCHCPHIFHPSKGYGGDIDVFDKLVGRVVKEIDADLIISGDHGHMKGEKGKIVYGFDVYEPAIKIPLICPRWFNESAIEYPVEQSQLKDLILNRSIEEREFIYSDTKYYEQPGRKLMIRKGSFKYIFNKRDLSEEIYDLDFDKAENINLLIEDWPDFDRKGSYRLDEVIHYPNWKKAEEHYLILKGEKNRIWRTGGWWIEMAHGLNTVRKKSVMTLFRRKPKAHVVSGRWGSRARVN